jgi:hypothetical protein
MKRKALRTMEDDNGVIWTIEHFPTEYNADRHIGYSDGFQGSFEKKAHYTTFFTRSGALRWMKRMVKEQNNRKKSLAI